MPADISNFIKKQDPASLVVYLAAVDNDIGVWRRSSAPQQAFGALKQSLREDLGKLSSAAAAPTPINPALLGFAETEMRLRLQSIEQEIGDYYGNKRALMENAQTWAIHFSDIRHLVTTFLVGLSWGVVTLRWDDYSPLIMKSAMGVWTLAVLLYAAFTHNTFKRMRREKENLSILLPEPPANNSTVLDWGWWHFGGLCTSLTYAWLLVLKFIPECGCVNCVLLFATAVLFGVAILPGRFQKLGERFTRSCPDLVIAAATIFFGLLLAAWAKEKPSTAYQLSISDSGQTVLVFKVPSPKDAADAIPGRLGASELERIKTAVKDTLKDVAREREEPPAPASAGKQD